MYKDFYASVILGEEQLNDQELSADLPCVHGWCMTTSEELWPQKLADFDEIEDPSYIRKLVRTELCDASDAIGPAQGEQGTELPCFIYHRPTACTDEPIPSGDWLQRNK